MTKVLIYSDLHIHAHKKNVNRIDDCLQVLKWVFETALSNKIKHIIFLGDLFHDRQKIDVLVYQKTFELFAEYSGADFHTHLLIGNHDMYYADRWDINSVRPLFVLPNVSVICEPTTLNIGKHEFDMLPYTENPLEDLLAFGNNRKFLGAHMSVDGAKLNSYGSEADVIVEHDGNMIAVTTDVFTSWKHVYLGHYHKPQILENNIEYIGSPLQLSFGEVDQEKHICILDLDTEEKQYVVNDFSPKHLLIPQAKLSDYDLNGNFVRVVFDDISSPEAVEIQKNIRQNNNVKSLEVRQVSKAHENEHVVKDAKDILLKEDEMIEKYIKDQEDQNDSPIEDLDKKLLLDIGKLICEEANNVFEA